MHSNDELISLEHVQDVAEKCLMEKGEYEVAKQYILYRQKHTEKRDQEKKETIEKFEHHQLKVIKSDGSWEFFEIAKVKSVYEKVARGYEEVCSFAELEKNLTKYLVDEIKTEDIMKMMIKAAIDLISMENIHWQFVAGRLLTIDLYKQSSRARKLMVEDLYAPEAFVSLVKEYVDGELYYQDFLAQYSQEDFLAAGKYLDPQRDMHYGYTTLLMLKKRYLLNPNQIIKELPQHMYMAVAMFLAVPEKKEERLEIAFKIYNIISTQKLSLATPCLMNARRKFHQLASCFKLNVGDDLRTIYHGIENIAQISKYGGGV